VLAFVKEKGWTKEEIEGAIQASGFDNSAHYLQDENNTALTLAQLLNSALGGG